MSAIATKSVFTWWPPWYLSHLSCGALNFYIVSFIDNLSLLRSYNNTE